MPAPLQWTLDFIDRWVAVFVVIGILGLTVLGWQLFEVQSRQGGDEARTCAIQNRGLKAQRHLTQVLAAFNVFIQPPSGKRAKSLPKPLPIPAYYSYSVKALRFHLPLYLRLQSKQPHGRDC